MTFLAFTKEHWRGFALAALCAASFSAGRFLRPTPHEVTTTAKTDDKKSKVADTDKDVTKDAAASRKVVLEFDPKCAPQKPLTLRDFAQDAPLPSGIVRATLTEAGPTQVVERTRSEVKTQEDVRTEVMSVDKPLPELPKWAAGTAVRLTTLDALDLTLEHRLFGSRAWVTAHAIQPMKLALPRDFFVGVRVEF